MTSGVSISTKGPRTVVTVGGTKRAGVIVAPDDNITITAPTGAPGPPGKPGPAGPPGEPGTSIGSSYTFVQGTPSAVWVINHPLTYFPAVTVVDSTGEEVEGDIVYTNANTVTVSFSGAFSGTAYLS